MGYVALYREWRPKIFEDVVGQEHISRTLQNAIKNNRIAHAYLFCGPRGTGKTSSAKVFAKALNCQQGPTVSPCNQCQNCLGINQGTSMDVLEIDAASNRGIDEIRDLRDKVKFSPTEGKFKVYIIDEVHMLTTEAFNALLKTLEEPPQHVVFILATTEPHKIPMTILSRCQRFDFRRITTEAIVKRLELVAEQSGAKVAKEALLLIARAAEGGMRDALSLLDQCIAFGGDVITLEEVNGVLGAVSIDLLLASAQSLAESDTTRGLQIINDLVIQGKDIRQYAKDLLEHLRNLLLVKVCSDVSAMLAMTPEVLAEIQRQAGLFTQERLEGLIALFSDAEREMKWSTQPRLLLELSVIRGNKQLAGGMAEVSLSPSPDLLDKLAEMEKKIARLEAQLEGKAVGSGLQDKKTTGPKSVVRNNRVTINMADNQPEELRFFQDNWTGILEGVRKSKVTVHALLINSAPGHFQKDVLTLVFPEDNSFHLVRLEQEENRRVVEQVIKKTTGREIRVRCAGKQDLITVSVAKDELKPEDDPLVQKAKEIFGPDLIEIKD
ncbi:MAG: DNA polymerase III subunit gamma/tau [Clostridia bacterium]|nr:DNA polymerase III subunit gamma/tau [Clostridia bacterium]